MTEQLKPCPFTGEKPKHGLTKGSRDMHGDLNQNYQVWTKYARVTAADKERAFEIWNTRPSASRESALDTTPDNTDLIAKYDDELRKVQGGWQDMDDPALEQIKKDGTDVLVYSIEGIELAWWSDGQSAWMTRDGTYVLEEPTHWMPLPPAPTEHPTEHPTEQPSVGGAARVDVEDVVKLAHSMTGDWDHIEVHSFEAALRSLAQEGE